MEKFPNISLGQMVAGRRCSFRCLPGVDGRASKLLQFTVSTYTNFCQVPGSSLAPFPDRRRMLLFTWRMLMLQAIGNVSENIL